ncbi:hypothetical protein NKR23_g1459 [Pleurostoma richardsiae]|uniref:Uncharacterized protein n=1 Tax=Pleurostoma richardsiae TaxID=41990 RepID=A0AA38RT26_9PEZI|nr:hypothetical protein NKR23_g1459 [Pleurostoma richardsiae]
MHACEPSPHRISSIAAIADSINSRVAYPKIKMPAIKSLVAREAVSHIAKRSNWAGKEAGVVLVFCIIFVVGVGLIALFTHKWLVARRQRKAAQQI